MYQKLAHARLICIQEMCMWEMKLKLFFDSHTNLGVGRALGVTKLSLPGKISGVVLSVHFN